MTALLLDPHGDDAVLFACFTLIREQPRVVVTHPTVPRDEIDRAMWVTNCKWGLAPKPPLERFDVVYAPAFHPEGHDEHNAVAEYASSHPNVISYATYAPRAVRQKGEEVIPDESWWYACKLRALSCFVSQIEQESTRPWFTSLLDLREWCSE